MPKEDLTHIRLLVLDVDGVLTDGSVLLDDEGRQIHRFHVHDGMGVRLWQEAGFEVAVISARTGPALQRRMEELGIERVLTGISDKAEALRSLAEDTGIEPAAMAYLGDDWTDAPAMRLVGYPMTVGDGAIDLREITTYRTTSGGGHGAVREAILWLLASKNLLNEARTRYGLPEREPLDAPGAASTRPPPGIPIPPDPQRSADIDAL